MTVQSRWFGTVTGKVAFNPKVGPNAARIYLVLVMYRNREDNTCFPSNETLQNMTGMSESTVKRGLRELVGLGVIERERRFRDGRETTSLTTLTDTSDPPGGHG